MSDHIVTSGLKKSGYEHLKEWNELNEGDINADLIVLGSSRAWIHISPAILDSMLNVDSYNLGLNGHNFHLQYAKYAAYLEKNRKPKTIIYSLDITSLIRREILFNKYQFLPYTDIPIVAESLMEYKHGIKKAETLIPLLKYRKEHDLIKIGVEEFFALKHYSNDKYKGYKSYDTGWSDIAKDHTDNHIELDSATVNLFESFVEQCLSDEIELIIVYTPSYVRNQAITANRAEVMNTYRGIADKYDLEYWDYSQDSICFDKKYFMDGKHMNKTGAELFTYYLADRMVKHKDISI